MACEARFPSGRRSSRGGVRRRAVTSAALLALAGALVAGCGSDGGPEESADSGEVVDISGTEAVGEELAGSVAPLVECRDWNGADGAEKLATIEDVRSQQNRQDPGVEEIELTDEEAEEFFDSACAPPYAQGFRLYKLYARANSFLPLKRALDG